MKYRFIIDLQQNESESISLMKTKIPLTAKKQKQPRDLHYETCNRVETWTVNDIFGL